MNTPTFEPINMHMNHYDAPGQFYWRGKKYHIDAIERIRRHSHGQRFGQRTYQIRSRGRRFTLRYDRKLQRWYLVRAPWRVRLSLAVERLAARIST